jgi:hypothetical protein
VAFFAPYFWSKWASKEPRFVNELLDSRPSNPNRALQMETQHIPSAQATTADGVTYARITPVQFPSDEQGQSPLVHQVTSYNRQALWQAVQSWFEGGEACAGKIDADQAVIHEFAERGQATWKIYADGTANPDKVGVAWNDVATPSLADSMTYGYRWNKTWVRRSDISGRPLVVLPEFYRQEAGANGQLVWKPVEANDVPAETGLADVTFARERQRTPKVYVTPDEADSCWKTPGPQAGPFYADLGDGSRLTYYWYRFADQPAMLNADLSDAEREVVQGRVEKIHAQWHKDREYLPPPRMGELAELDPALIVTPPAGLEIGYVPIVTRQEPQSSSDSN